MQPVGHDQKQRAQRGLVQRRKADAGKNQRQPEPHQHRPHLRQSRKLFCRDGKELQRQHGQVQHHAPAHFKQRRMRIPVHHHVPDVPGQAQVEEQAERNRCVAEERGQHGRPHDGVEPFQLEDVDHGRDDESTSRQRDAAHYVEADPQSPGVGVAQVGRRPQTKQEARRRHRERQTDAEP